jgi:hypothetical protein
VSARDASKADLHDLVDERPDETVETARRFLRSLRAARDTENFVARFIESMDPEEAALLDGLAESDHRDGPPAFVAADSDPQG